MPQRVLIIDDDAGIRDALRMILDYEGYEVAAAADGPSGLAELEANPPDAVLCDIKMPGMDGFEVLDRIAAREGAPPVLVISGHGDIATAVEATRRGAVDFLEKPPQRERILVSLANALSRNTLAAENRRLRRRLEEESVLVGSSAPMAKLREEAARAAPTQATVLITGESGTGKEVIAREIHRASRVAKGPFIEVNCAAIPEELIESELFGHEKGSFTGAVRKQTGKFVEADGGTIFLDEVGDMSARAQAKVLRVLEAGEVEPVGAARVRKVIVRVIAATNRDLTEAIRRRPFSRGPVLPAERPADAHAPAPRTRRRHSGARRALLEAVLRARPQEDPAVRSPVPRPAQGPGPGPATCGSSRTWSSASSSWPTPIPSSPRTCRPRRAYRLPRSPRRG